MIGDNPVFTAALVAAIVAFAVWFRYRRRRPRTRLVRSKYGGIVQESFLGPFKPNRKRRKRRSPDADDYDLGGEG